jgi:DNA-binding NarL/FixJ family response regulator
MLEIVDDHALALLRRAARQLGGPAASFDRAGLIALGGSLGATRATLYRGGAGGPSIVVVQQSDDQLCGIFGALSGRERQVAALISAGWTNRQIAQELWISVATVKDHVPHILAKTGLANRSAVAGRWRSQHASAGRSG